jgi:Archaea bacterial proteins of unknown function
MVGRASCYRSDRWIIRRSASPAGLNQRQRHRLKNSPASAAFPNIGSLSNPEKPSWIWWNRCFSTSRPTWSRSHGGSSMTRDYWDKFAEIDLVCLDPKNPAGLLAGELKWKRLTSQDYDRVFALEPMPIKRPPSGCPFQSLRCRGAAFHLKDALTAESSFHPCESSILSPRP